MYEYDIPGFQGDFESFVEESESFLAEARYSPTLYKAVEAFFAKLTELAETLGLTEEDPLALDEVENLREEAAGILGDSRLAFVAALS